MSRRSAPLAPLLLALVLAATVLTACQKSGEKYVAIGDSYTAGPGIGRSDGRDTCFRSKDNYPHKVADEADLRLDDVSCSAAATSALRTGQKTPWGRTVDPQLDAVTKDTDVVTLSIGANDFNLIGRIFQQCVQLTKGSREGSPCTDADTASGPQSARQRFPVMQEHVEQVISDVRSKAPGALVLVVGYPDIFPEDEVCDLLPITPGDLAWARMINRGLNEALAGAAKAENVEYIDAFTATTGHDICAAEPWIAGAKVIDGRKSTPWHPYEEEQEAVAKLILEALD